MQPKPKSSPFTIPIVMGLFLGAYTGYLTFDYSRTWYIAIAFGICVALCTFLVILLMDYIWERDLDAPVGNWLRKLFEDSNDSMNSNGR